MENYGLVSFAQSASQYKYTISHSSYLDSQCTPNSATLHLSFALLLRFILSLLSSAHHILPMLMHSPLTIIVQLRLLLHAQGRGW